MEHAGRSVAVLLERTEERCPIARGNPPVQDRQVQLEHAFAGVEHPAEVLAETPGDVLDLDLGHQVQVEFGSQLRQ